MKMKKNNTRFVGRWQVFAAVVIGAGLLNASHGYAQDTKTAAPAAAAKSDTPTKSTAEGTKDAAKDVPAAEEKSAEKAEAPPKKAAEAAPVSPAAPAATAAPPKDVAPRTTAAAKTEEKAASKETAMPAGKTEPSPATKAIQNLGVQEQVRSGWSPWVLGAVILALFVLPIMAGNYLAKMWRMPEHAWKISLVI